MEKTAINFSSEVQAAIDSQKATIQSAQETLCHAPSDENALLYKNAIRDFISFAVTQIYTLSTQSGWQDIPCRDLYSKASGVEIMLEDLESCINQNDAALLQERCGKIDELLDSLLVRS